MLERGSKDRKSPTHFTVEITDVFLPLAIDAPVRTQSTVNGAATSNGSHAVYAGLLQKCSVSIPTRSLQRNDCRRPDSNCRLFVSAGTGLRCPVPIQQSRGVLYQGAGHLLSWRCNPGSRQRFTRLSRRLPSSVQIRCCGRLLSRCGGDLHSCWPRGW